MWNPLAQKFSFPRWYPFSHKFVTTIHWTISVGQCSGSSRVLVWPYTHKHAHAGNRRGFAWVLIGHIIWDTRRRDKSWGRGLRTSEGWGMGDFCERNPEAFEDSFNGYKGEMKVGHFLKWPHPNQLKPLTDRFDLVSLRNCRVSSAQKWNFMPCCSVMTKAGR